MGAWHIIDVQKHLSRLINEVSEGSITTSLLIIFYRVLLYREISADDKKCSSI